MTVLVICSKWNELQYLNILMLIMSIPRLKLQLALITLCIEVKNVHQFFTSLTL